MSSFFTLPASQRKRKRTEAPSSKPSGPGRRTTKTDEESISGSDVSDEDAPAREVGAEESEDEEEEFGDEDPAAKRIRLAEQYLANTQQEVLEDGGFDAAEVDQENLRRRMGERLKQDTAESKGKLYKWVAEGLDWRGATTRVLRSKDVGKSLNGVAIHGQNIFGVSKDMHIVKWDPPEAAEGVKNRRPRKTWKVMRRTHGARKGKQTQHHHSDILCVAASEDGKFLATGGADRKLIIWDATSLKPLKVFNQHRDAVTELAFRKGSNQLFSASKDRTVKIWSLDELAYVETLFGHQDEVVSVSALSQEKCVTAGARDRTARLWKVVEESQLVFRGGGAPGTHKALQSLRKAYEEDSGIEIQDDEAYHEGSIDRVAMVDDDTFITASDNGAMSLWNINKKKAVYTLPLAHGLDPPVALNQASAEQEPDETLDEKGRGGKQPRWVTALAVVPFSDVVISGSWDGYVRAWKISQDKRRIVPLGAIGVAEAVDTLLKREGLSSDSISKDALDAMHKGVSDEKRINGIVNDLAVVETGDRGKESLLIAAAVGKEHRLGGWKNYEDGKNCVVVFQVHRKTLAAETDEELTGVGSLEESHEDAEFEGLD
ncbi:pre-rRNA processing protein [Saxophila tyrrhenica]|uniref:Pre-rRNA processing protein n=1 Tax=Saxophila tyrrhenica TaxID=1690608 RepID=A0AAV9PMC3_9PEZI|nr:pre-rRNA processing protein [Saxophila tyrrhenica]